MFYVCILNRALTILSRRDDWQVYGWSGHHQGGGESEQDVTLGLSWADCSHHNNSDNHYNNPPSHSACPDPEVQRSGGERKVQFPDGGRGVLSAVFSSVGDVTAVDFN